MDDKRAETLIKELEKYNNHHCLYKDELIVLKKHLILIEAIKAILTPKMVFTLTICVLMILNSMKG